MNITGSSHNEQEDLDLHSMPQLPEIPQVILCLHLPYSEGWSRHWSRFSRKLKDFHQAMIDYNYKMLEWYKLKSIQLERFGVKRPYIAGTLVTAHKITIIYTKPISDAEVEVMPEVKQCLPASTKEEICHLEKTGYKLCLVGKIFIFNKHNVIIIDYDQKESDKIAYKDCLAFTLYHRNEKINISEQYRRVYGGVFYSLILGGVGGFLVSLFTGYFNQPPPFARNYTERSLLWLAAARTLSSSAMFTILERLFFLKFPQPRKYALSATSGAICGTIFGLYDNATPETILYSASEFGILALMFNIFVNNGSQCNTTGGGNRGGGNRGGGNTNPSGSRTSRRCDDSGKCCLKNKK